MRETALPLRGNGIFVTRDGGTSWTPLASTATSDFHWVNDLVISRRDSARIYAATRSGVWRSTDGGEQWTRVLPVTVKGGCLDLEIRADAEGDYLFASCGTFEPATVYRNRSAETSQSWEPVLTAEQMGRTTLAIAPSNPSIVYALAANNEPGLYHQGLFALFRSTQNGDFGTWEARATSTSTDHTARLLLTNAMTTGLCVPSDGVVNMGWYTNTIAVDPVNANRVWAGSVDSFRSDDGGATWGVASYWWGAETPSSVHADQHAFVFHPRYDGITNRTMFVLNDGGIYRTDDATAAPARGESALCTQNSNIAFTSLNHNFGITQFYHGAVYPDGRTFLGGTQDNGTLRGSIDNGPDAWKRIFFGDGGYVAVDPHDTNILFAEAQGGFLVRSDSGGEQFDYLLNLVDDSFLFIAPFTLDPNDSTRIWIGGTRMWRSNSRGRFWTAASEPMRGKISAIAVMPGASSRVLAGTSEGDIARSDQALVVDARTQWPAAHPRDGFVSSIAFDPSQVTRVYATYAGFGGGAHVWMSTDSGVTWAPLDGSGSGALPDIPVHSIAVDPTRPDRLYLGTDLGVFVSTNRGETWAVENTGFAAAVTETVVIAQGARGPAVYAFTHGRGAWRAELTPVASRRRAVRK